MFRIISIISGFLCVYVILGTAGSSDLAIFEVAEISTTDIMQNFLIALMLFCISYLSEFTHRAIKK